jgi:hypothetical protein
VSIDLKRTDARATFMRLVAQADILLEGFRLGVAERHRSCALAPTMRPVIYPAEDEIHVGHVIVDGAIAGDKIFQRFPDAASREESLISVEAIVNAFAFLYGASPRVGHLRLTPEPHAKSGERSMPPTTPPRCESLSHRQSSYATAPNKRR